jgi:hypothetical protein
VSSKEGNTAASSRNPGIYRLLGPGMSPGSESKGKKLRVSAVTSGNVMSLLAASEEVWADACGLRPGEDSTRDARPPSLVTSGLDKVSKGFVRGMSKAPTLFSALLKVCTMRCSFR